MNKKNKNKNADLNLESLEAELSLGTPEPGWDAPAENSPTKKEQQESKRLLQAQAKEEKKLAKQQQQKVKAGDKAKDGITGTSKAKTKMAKAAREQGAGGSKLMLVIAILLMVVGTALCLRTVKWLNNRQQTTEAESISITELRQKVDNLEATRAALPEVSETFIELVNKETRVDDQTQEALKQIAEESGLIVHKTTVIEKKNESGILKAHYILEGAAQTTNIVSFLDKVRSDRMPSAMLFEEVTLLEGTRVSVGLGGTDSNEATLVKEFRIVMQDSYNKVNLSEISEGEPSKVPNTAITSAGEVTRPPHVHDFSNIGWQKAPTELDAGYKVAICAECNEVKMETVPAGITYHAWSIGPCGERECSVCGAKENKTAPIHFMGAWTIITDSTCYIQGVRERTCVNPECKFVEKEVIPKKSHKYIMGEDGREICQVCGMPRTADLEVKIN